MADISRKVVIDRCFYPVDHLPPGRYVRTAGSPGIIAYHIEFGATYKYCGVGLTSEESRLFLTYFDQIDIPHVEENDYEDENMHALKQLGFLVRSFSPTPDHIAGHPVDEYLPDFTYFPRTAFEQRRNEEPGVWSIAVRGENPYVFKPVGTQEKGQTSPSSLEVELYSCLPVPHEDTPYEDVMRFREDYRGELNSLRLDVSNLAASLSTTDISVDRINLAKSNIQYDVSEISKAMQGRGIVSRYISLQTEYKWAEFAKAGATTTLLEGVGAPFPIAVALGIVSAAIKIRTVPQRVQPSPKSSIDLAYVTHLYRSMLIPKQ